MPTPESPAPTIRTSTCCNAVPFVMGRPYCVADLVNSSSAPGAHCSRERWEEDQRRVRPARNARRSDSQSAWTKQLSSWSFVSPSDCMKAYAVVGPTNRQPRRLSSFDSAVDRAVTAGTPPSSVRSGVSTAQLQIQSTSGPSASISSIARWALLIVASILPRWRMIPASPSSRSTSRSPNCGDPLDVEAGERRAEVLAFAQDRDPAQPGLEALQADLLEQPTGSVVGRPHSVSW